MAGRELDGGPPRRDESQELEARNASRDCKLGRDNVAGSDVAEGRGVAQRDAKRDGAADAIR
eukprot:4839864-Prymnesium_polylepis.1